jgi:hypothetical protein
MENNKMFHTEFKFTLHKGLMDADGFIHRQGRMRLPTGKDEICVQKDRRVLENPAYGVLKVLSQVITYIGGISEITPELLEELFLVDMIYLQKFFNNINQETMEISMSGE